MLGSMEQRRIGTGQAGDLKLTDEQASKSTSLNLTDEYASKSTSPLTRKTCLVVIGSGLCSAV